MTSRFELLSELGRGGMGTVWKARDRETGEVVALKLLHEFYVSDPDYVARFGREVDIARRIDSPGVVKVLGYGQHQGRPYVAMEYVSGKSLKELLKEQGPLGWPEARVLFLQLLAGLEDAHRAGVLHRDIKPGNLLIDHEGRLKITDFGISRAADLTRMTGSMTVLGTPAYMAPEGQDDARSELYSAGCVLYEMLAGAPPFEGDSMHAVIVKHLRDEPDLARLPAQARDIVRRLLDKEPSARPASAAAASALLNGDANASLPGRGQERVEPGLRQTSPSRPPSGAWSLQESHAVRGHRGAVPPALRCSQGQASRSW